MLLLITALVSAIYLTWGRGLHLGPALVAAVVLGIELGLRQGWFRLPTGTFPMHTIFALTIAVCGWMLFVGEGPRLRVAAATCVLLVGVVQTLSAFKIA